MICTVIPINRSDFTFESSFSSIVRTYELFRPEKYVIIHAKFNSVHLEKLKYLFEKLKEKGKKIEMVSTESISDFNSFKNIIDEKTKECEKVYLVPTSGANIIAVFLALLSKENQRYQLVNYIFSFGPWTHFYYPFVPRDLEVAYTLEGKITNKPSLDLNLDPYLERNEFVRNIQMFALKINKKFDSCREMSLKVNGVDILRTWSVNYHETVKLLNKHVFSNEDVSEALLKLSGAYDILVEGKKLEEVSYGRTVVIDTNLIYFGIHTHEIRDLAIPYCADDEILRSVNKKDNPISYIIFYVYQALLQRSKIIPSKLTICDVAIPKIEPDLIKGALVITNDKNAFERWKELSLRSYAEVEYAELDKSNRRNSFAEVTSVIFNMVSLLKLMHEKIPQSYKNSMLKLDIVEICCNKTWCIDVLKANKSDDQKTT
ncbi:hypothetical protein STK_00350 [Sulfurisphaera tokodaii str. 7]|uniref:PIN domain-containing protein n=1 Tax=Sulfurisphaera tokodaii (strain DSM 16993 / JCM 10545 / NBRC 100140 / 7) TaxID=273063 RepID=Q977A8_SULTO|nr:hypothetical protein [Sulfurisphaera tokodaii]BAB64986.1 hypothetical protein STK_00350 [Sulfurisphaera tokodaii str. 7]